MTGRQPTYIVAELSANHGHKIENALATVHAAKEAGADAIKIQTYTADTITLDCDDEPFRVQQGTIWDGTTLYKLYTEAYTPWEWHEAIRDEAQRIGIDFFSTPFDNTAVDFLEGLGVPLYKIASFELTDIELIKYTASKHKPMIMSTGIATLGEIKMAVDACRSVGNEDITLLKCTSQYPAPIEDANLLTIPNMKDTFNVKVGLSDHTMGSEVALAAVALGATLVEKHFILDRAIGGPDASFSMEPADFSYMVKSIRLVEKSLGTVNYDMTEKVRKSRHFSRSLFAVQDIKAGELFTVQNFRSIRPGIGLDPAEYHEVMGSRARKEIKRGTPLSWDLVDGSGK